MPVTVIERSVPDNVELDFSEFTPNKVRAAIKKLKAGGSCGPDGYPPLLFKRITDSFEGPFSLILTSPCQLVKLLSNGYML
jgi:hypothetical protein